MHYTRVCYQWLLVFKNFLTHTALDFFSCMNIFNMGSNMSIVLETFPTHCTCESFCSSFIVTNTDIGARINHSWNTKKNLVNFSLKLWVVLYLIFSKSMLHARMRDERLFVFKKLVANIALNLFSRVDIFYVGFDMVILLKIFSTHLTSK